MGRKRGHLVLITQGRSETVDRKERSEFHKKTKLPSKDVGSLL